MMLSPKARIDAIPSVLVSADDVSASHGGTVGELDEAAIFYMQTRGLDRPAAVRVIVEGFFEPLISELADEPWRRWCGSKVAANWRRHARTSRPMPPAAESALGRQTPTSRSSGGASGSGRSSTWTRPRPRRSRRSVIDAQADHLRNHNANVHRGVYPLAEEADAAFEGARERIAAFTGADPRTTIFTKNVTEAINLVAYAWGRANIGPGDAVLITQMEHHANIVPWQVLCRERGATPSLPGGGRARRALARLRSTASSRAATCGCVAFAHVSNVLGTINPVAEMTARARAARRRDAHRRRPGRPADARRRARDRRRLLRLDGPQGARADGHRGAPRQRASCSTRCRRS